MKFIIPYLWPISAVLSSFIHHFFIIYSSFINRLSKPHTTPWMPKAFSRGQSPTQPRFLEFKNHHLFSTSWFSQYERSWTVGSCLTTPSPRRANVTDWVSQNFIWVFLYEVPGKPEWTFWPTQYTVESHPYLVGLSWLKTQHSEN